MQENLEAGQKQPWEDRVFAFWTGSNAMGENRKRCFDTLVNTECEIVLVNQENLASWIVEGHPLHPAYEYLSAVHRSDYLRAYFMHHHGGGYSDVKLTFESWRPAFAALRNSDSLGAGYPELRTGVARIKNSRLGGRYYLFDRPSSYPRNYLVYRKLKYFHDRLIGNGAFIFKPGTVVTARWLKIVEARLDMLLPPLKMNPSRYPEERGGVDYGSGPSQYPVPWTFIMGDIMSPLSYQYHDRILKIVPVPDFSAHE